MALDPEPSLPSTYDSTTMAGVAPSSTHSYHDDVLCFVRPKATEPQNQGLWAVSQSPFFLLSQLATYLKHLVKR